MAPGMQLAIACQSENFQKNLTVFIHIFENLLIKQRYFTFLYTSIDWSGLNS